MKERKNIPEIRFEGFEGEWEEVRLGDLSDSFEYGLNAAAITYDGYNKYIRITDIDDESRLFLKNELTSPNTNLDLADNYKLRSNDILFARTGASVGKSYIYKESDGLVYFAGFLIRARINPNVNSYFVFQNTLTDTYKRFIYITSQRSGQPGVNAQEYSHYSFKLPNLEEQSQIGTFFQNLDKQITLEQQKHDKLVTFKKAMLEKMFPKEGARVPEIRFEGFEGEWEGVRLGDLGTFKSNGVDKTSNINEIPVYLLNYMDVYNRRKINVQNYHKLMSVTAKASQVVDNNVLKNDVFFTPSSETPEDIGKVMVIEESLPNTVYSYHLVRYRPKENIFANIFPNYGFSSGFVRNQIILAAQGVQRFVINKNSFEELRVMLPSIKEQSQIGNYFQNLDKLISLQQQKIDKLKNIKKACLEKMFV